jgi:hypothetical protein
MRRWLLTTLLSVFIIGGFTVGGIGIHNLSSLSRSLPSSPNAAAASLVTPPTPAATPELAAHPPLRDFDQNPPPFAPAAPVDQPAPVREPTPAPDAAVEGSGHLNIDRALQLDVLPRLPQHLPEVRDRVRTDISLAEAVQLANYGRTLNPSQIVRLQPDPSLTPSYIGGGGAAYMKADFFKRLLEHHDPHVRGMSPTILLSAQFIWFD